MKAARLSIVLTLHHTPERLSLAATATGVPALKRLFQELGAAGYRFAPMAECGHAGPPPGSVLVSVDDGYASNARHLAPALRELGIPWTVFVLVGSLGRRNRWDHPLAGPRERHLTEGEVADLSREGVTIGSHGMTHRDLTRLDDAGLEGELSRSREVLSRLSGQGVDVISYPRGRVDARVALAARGAGYRLGFASLRAAGVPPGLASLAIRRTPLYAPDQIPGVFAGTGLGRWGPLAALRPALSGLGDTLLVAALAARRGRG